MAFSRKQSVSVSRATCPGMEDTMMLYVIRGDSVTAFRVDGKTGALAFTGQYTPVGNPSHIVFLDPTMRK